MGTALAVIYCSGWLASVPALRFRAGVPRGRMPFSTVFTSLPWLAASAVKMFLWPVALVVWVGTGRPESPWQLVESRRTGLLTVSRVQVR